MGAFNELKNAIVCLSLTLYINVCVCMCARIHTHTHRERGGGGAEQRQHTSVIYLYLRKSFTMDQYSLLYITERSLFFKKMNFIVCVCCLFYYLMSLSYFLLISSLSNRFSKWCHKQKYVRFIKSIQQRCKYSFLFYCWHIIVEILFLTFILLIIFLYQCR